MISDYLWVVNVRHPNNPFHRFIRKLSCLNMVCHAPIDKRAPAPLGGAPRRSVPGRDCAPPRFETKFPSFFGVGEAVADPYTIRIFVPDGNPEGLRVIDRMNWTGLGIAFPREEWPKIKQRTEFARAGVY